jgi:hypothetical protein
MDRIYEFGLKLISLEFWFEYVLLFGYEIYGYLNSNLS